MNGLLFEFGFEFVEIFAILDWISYLIYDGELMLPFQLVRRFETPFIFYTRALLLKLFTD